MPRPLSATTTLPFVAHDMASGALAPKKPQYGDPDYYSFKPGESL